MQTILFRVYHVAKFRVLPMLLAMIMLLSVAPLTVFSVDLSEEPKTDLGYDSPSELPYDYDTLKITLDGKETYALSLYEHEKIEISATGVAENATYQWQIQHNENDDLWVNIYDATEPTLPLTAALIGGVLREDNTAKVRCRAYTQDCAYLTTPITVTLLEGMPETDSVTVSTPSFTQENPSFMAGEGTPEYYTVAVEYHHKIFVYNDITGEYDLVLLDDPIFAPYIASLEPNSSFETFVPHPTIVGYDTFLVTVDTDGNIIEERIVDGVDGLFISIGTVDKNYVYVIEYRPALVDYEVRYYFQNIYDDLYIEDSSIKAKDEKQGYAGTKPEIDMSANTFPGFTPLFYVPDTIAADGSTVFEVYFERNYYLMNFDCNGGYGTETVYVRYGSYISVPEPQKMGYQFDGWNKGTATTTDTGSGTITTVTYPTYVEGSFTPSALPDKMPAEHTYYRAEWKRVDTSYTIIYWCADLDTDNNPDTVTYSYWGQTSVEALSASEIIPSVAGANHLATTAIVGEFAPYFAYDASTTAAKNPTNVTIAGDGSSKINVYYNRKEYTIRFIYARSRNGRYYLASSTGCGQYNNEYDDSVDHNGSAYGNGHSNVSWSYEVSSVPAVSDSNHVAQSFTEDGYTYHYISVTAEFGADIEDVWPDASLARGRYGGTYYDFGSWGAECASPYRAKYTADHANIVGPYPIMGSDMIVDPSYSTDNPAHPVAQTMVAWWGRGADNVLPHFYHIYYETLPGQSGDVQYNGVWYTLDRTLEFTAAHNTNTRVDPVKYDGFTCVNDDSKKQSNSENFSNGGTCNKDNNDGTHAYCNSFYYLRQEYALSFFNYNDSSLTPASEQMAYMLNVNSYANGAYFSEPPTPVTPYGLEPGAYEFKGWYLSPTFETGTEVDWQNLKMPAGPLTLYAKWVPVQRTVTFYWDYDEMMADKSPFLGPVQVTHGAPLESAYNVQPKRDGYAFVGWFYMDEDNKKRFAPDTMEVKRDLDLFAEWQSSIPVQYELKYIQVDPSGNPIDPPTIVEPVVEYSTAGLTKTFYPKTGVDLPEKFRKGYFPMVNSHSILMKAPDKDGEGNYINSFTFKYIKKDYVNYKVRYVNASSGVVMGESDVKQAEQAIVTEYFKYFKDMVPTQYYVRKTIAYDPTDYSVPGNENHVLEDNIITFYYLPDAEHGMYLVEYFRENPESDDPDNKNNYTYMNSTFGTADKNTPVSAPISAPEGFEHNESLATVIEYVPDGSGGYNEKPEFNGTTGTVTPGGLIIRIYYKRIKYPYLIKFVEYGNESNVLGYGAFESTAILNQAEAYSLFQTDLLKFDTEHEYTAPASIEKGGMKYNLASEIENPKTLTVRVDEADTSVSPAKLPENNVLVFYYEPKIIYVNYVAVCSVSGLVGGTVTPSWEPVKGTDSNTGGKATALAGYQFMGWYSDKACTNKVSDDTLYKPTGLTKDSYTFYALFEPLYGSVMISQTGTSASDTSDHHFLFHIKGKNNNNKHIDLVVSILGNGTATIDYVPIGEYTVTELDAWSWDYTEKSGAFDITVEENKSTQVTFENNSKNSNWLSGETAKDNEFN